MSLKIEKKNEGTKDTVFLTGRLDTATAPELDTFAEKELINTQELVLDFAGLEYISSAGLRVILKMQKFMNVKGTMKLIHVSDIIQDVFDITGFADILNEGRRSGFEKYYRRSKNREYSGNYRFCKFHTGSKWMFCKSTDGDRYCDR